MKKIILAVVLVTIVVVAGFASVRFRPSAAFTAHTIIYRITNYDEDEKLTESSLMVRHVTADGTWRHLQVAPDGKVVTPNGKLTGGLTTREVNEALPAHLNYRYFADKNSETETWISPELQDFLMLTTLRSDGSKIMKMEAIEITKP